MDQITAIMETQLTEKELILFLLIESGMTARDISERIGMSNVGVSKLYKRARAKIEKAGAAGYFQTKVKEPVDKLI